MLTGSAYMREPWGVSTIYGITDAEYRGLQYIPADKLKSIARLSFDNGFQFTAHSVGDGAVHALIEAYESINRDLPLRDHRPCITHCNFMSREAIALCATSTLTKPGVRLYVMSVCQSCPASGVPM